MSIMEQAMQEYIEGSLEQEKELNINKLRDGREFWTTDNGFTCWLKDQQGRVMPTSEEYYRTKLIARLRLERSKKFRRENK